MDRHTFQQEKKWRTHPLRSTAKSGMIAMWVFAAIWNAISFPMAIFLPFLEEIQKGNYPVLVALLFPLIGVLLIALAISRTREYRRFGVTELWMDPFPGALDGDVGGHIRINNQSLAGTPCEVTLACVYSYESGSGDDRSRSERIQWSESGVVTPAFGGSEVRLDFRFQPDAGLPESQQETGNYYFWRLSIRAELPGADLNRQFVIPVFRTGEKSRFTRVSLSDLSKQQRKQQAEENVRAISSGGLDHVPLGKNLRVTHDGLSTSYYYGMGQDRLISVFFLFFAVAFGAATFGVGSFGDGTDHWLAAIFTSLFALPFLLVAVAASVLALYLPLRSLRVTFSPDEIAIVRRWWWIPIRRRRVSYDDVLAVYYDFSGSQSSTNDKKAEYFKILLVASRRAVITIAESIEDKELARQLTDHFAEKVRQHQRDVGARRTFQSGQTQLRDGNIDELVRTLLRRGQKLGAVKLVKAVTGRGLKEAKDYVEELSKSS